MTIRFTVKTIERLCDLLRSLGRRRAPLRARAAQDRGRPLRHAAGALHQGLPAEHAEPGLGRGKVAAGKGWSAVLGRNLPAVQELQQKLIDLREARDRADRRPAGDQQAHERGRGQLARSQARDDRGQPAPGDLDRQEVHQPRPAVPRPDPGRQHRPDEGGRQVRIPPRLQVLDLRDLVDPSGHHPPRSPTRPAPSGFRCT